MAFFQRFTLSKDNPPAVIESTPSSIPTSMTTSASSQAEQSSSWISPRSRKQLGLFWAGAGFFMLSSLLTRRVIRKRFQAAIPKFYEPSNRPVQINGAMEAFDALNVATVNVLSVTVMVAGGLSWVFDVSSLEDLRWKARTITRGAGDVTDRQLDEEMEEWIVGVLARKDFKEMLKQANEEVDKKGTQKEVQKMEAPKAEEAGKKSSWKFW